MQKLEDALVEQYIMQTNSGRLCARLARGGKLPAAFTWLLDVVKDEVTKLANVPAQDDVLASLLQRQRQQQLEAELDL